MSDDQTDNVLDGTPRFDEPSAAALLPCPHCNEKPFLSHIVDHDLAEWWSVGCDRGNCLFCVEAEFDTGQEAITAWNAQLGTAARVAEAEGRGAVRERARILNGLRAFAKVGGIAPNRFVEFERMVIRGAEQGGEP